MKLQFLNRIAGVVTALAVMITSFTVFSVPAFADNSKARDARQGTVVIETFVTNAVQCAKIGNSLYKMKEYGDTTYSLGTGFFVGTPGKDVQYLVTNQHVIDDFVSTSKGDDKNIYLGTAEVEGVSVPVYLVYDKIELRVCYSETDYEAAYVQLEGDVDDVDLAVLRLGKPTDKRKALSIRAVTDDMVGEKVYAIGYPGIAENVLSGASSKDVADATFTDGTISRIVMNEGHGVERINTTATINHGNSGGPLVDENGNVLGVNTNSITEGTDTRYYSISSNTLINFLRRDGNITFTEAGSGSMPKGVLVAIIVVAAVVVVGAIAAVLIVMNKKKKANAAAVGAAPAQAVGGSAPQRQAAVGANAAANGQAAATKKAFIRSMSPQHNGRTFPVGNAPVTIGRNASVCAIVFNDKTPGVSGQHCSVSYDSNTGLFTLTDLNSTYGTVLFNGQKLNPGQSITLKPGTSFYVGDKANSLKVEVE